EHAGSAHEFGWRGRGAGRPAFCGANELQRTGAMDCCNLGSLRDWLADSFASQRLLGLRSGAVRGGVRGDVADGGDQHPDPESRAGRAAEPSDGGLRDNVHGCTADWGPDRGRNCEAHWSATYVDSFRSFSAAGEPCLYFACGDETG